MYLPSSGNVLVDTTKVIVRGNPSYKREPFSSVSEKTSKSLS